MAPVKTRSSKRSSGSSCSSSTVTTTAFLALCVLGVWLMSSNSFSPLKSTSRTIAKDPEPVTPIDTLVHHDHPKHSMHEEDHEPVHEDIPGDLPEDVIKSVDTTQNDDASHVEEETQAEEKAASSNDSDASGEESANGKEEPNVMSDENGSMEPKDLRMSNGKDSRKEEPIQLEHEAQVSEESSAAQKQEVEPMSDEKHESSETGKSEHGNDQNIIEKQDLEETRNVEKQQMDDSPEITRDQEGMGEHQQQNQDSSTRREKQGQSKQDPHGATSDDQIQHDEARVDSSENGKDFQGSEGVSNTQESSKESGAKESNQETSTKSDESTIPNAQNTGIPKESNESKKLWSTQAAQSVNEKERRNAASSEKDMSGFTWKLCNVTAGADYIPCLDNLKAIAKIHSMKHYEHRERHCPEEPPTCLVQLPEGYKKPITWPQSRDKIWYHNVPHTLLAEVKGHQNWVKVTGEFLTFPGGGTQFIHGALHYIDFIQEAVPDIAWGKHTRVILDVGCGVASFGGFLFERDVLAMSFAPKDEHEAQIQFALERGIPAISAVMGSKRLPFPSRVFDIVHCARCRVPWHADGGALLLELNRVLRPGGYFVWSATPVYQTLEEDVQIWREMSNLTAAMCWELVTIKKDKLNSIGAAIYHKPSSNDCYEKRKLNQPPMCKNEDDPNAAWYVPLQSCMHRVPTEKTERGSQWPDKWPKRLQTPPYWLNRSRMGIYGKPAPNDFASDYEHWMKVVMKSYMSDLGISWSNVRNTMDMRAVYGGFAAALKDLKVWVMNVVNIDSPDTLPIIYERGLFGIYHDWCESFSTYPRTYDLLHADHLFSKLKKRCKLVGVLAEVDRIVRPGGYLIVRDESNAVGEVENMLKSLHWEVKLTFSKNQEGLLSAQKAEWRPGSYADVS